MFVYLSIIILVGIIGIELNLMLILRQASPRAYRIFKLLCMVFATTAYILYFIDQFVGHILWIDGNTFRVFAVRPIVTMLFVWFLLDAYLRQRKSE